MLGLFFLLRKRKGFFDIVVKDASSLAKASLIAKIRALVSNFPNISSRRVATNVLATIKNPFLFFRDFMRVRMRCGFF